MHAPDKYLFEVFTAAMAIMSAITLWMAIYWPKLRETRQLSLWSLVVLTALLAAALGIARLVRW